MKSFVVFRVLILLLVSVPWLSMIELSSILVLNIRSTSVSYGRLLSQSVFGSCHIPLSICIYYSYILVTWMYIVIFSIVNDLFTQTGLKYFYNSVLVLLHEPIKSHHCPSDFPHFVVRVSCRISWDKISRYESYVYFWVLTRGPLRRSSRQTLVVVYWNFVHKLLKHNFSSLKCITKWYVKDHK